MPSAKSAITDKPQRHRQDSQRKREAKAQASAEDRARKEQKERAKERRRRREDDEEDALLVEREGESSEYRKLRERNAKLESELQHAYAQIDKHEKKEPEVPMIEMPRKKTEIKVEKIRAHLGLDDAKGDAKWSDIRAVVRRMMYGAQLNWDLPWSRQKPERLCMAYSKIEQEAPELQRFENHWVSEFLMQESFQNHRTHAGAKHYVPDPSDASSAKPTKSAKPSTKPSKPSKAAKPPKRVIDDRNVKEVRSDDDDNLEDKNMSRPDSNTTQGSGPYNDGETEIEDVPVQTDRNSVAREDSEDSSPNANNKGKAPAKTLAKQDRARLQRTDFEVIPRPAPKKPQRPATPPFSTQPASASGSTLTANKKPVYTAKRGRGRGGKGGKGGERRVAESSPRAVQSGSESDPDAVALSESSGQTTSASDT